MLFGDILFISITLLVADHSEILNHLLAYSLKMSQIV
jgi:hypothetical protein